MITRAQLTVIKQKHIGKSRYSHKCFLFYSIYLYALCQHKRQYQRESIMPFYATKCLLHYILILVLLHYFWFLLEFYKQYYEWAEGACVVEMFTMQQQYKWNRCGRGPSERKLSGEMCGPLSLAFSLVDFLLKFLL